MVTLQSDLDRERAEAIQHLLRQPLVDVESDREAYTLVARHAPWLIDWFDVACGWTLHVDAAGGFARLAKRHAEPDPTRPLLRRRGSGGPFDRRRYELLCLVAAELVSHQVTTVGLLAQAVASSGDFATDRHRDRVAFVDALLVLQSWRAVSVTSGDLEDFAGDERANALLTADLSRLHRLIDSAVAPSRLDAELPFEAVVDELLREPRYGSAEHADVGDPNRWIRHHLARQLLDGPVLHLDECTEAELSYLSSGAGREWLRARVAEAGFTLEERAEGMLAVDDGARATDETFPAPNGTVHQLALLLVDELVEPTDGPDGPTRSTRNRTMVELTAATARRLDAHPSWARAYQGDGGAGRLTADAVALLASFGLVRTDDTVVEARPALCRYSPAEPQIAGRSEPALF